VAKNYKLTAIIRDKRGLILSIGTNSYIKTHTAMYRLEKELGVSNPKKNFLHAEIDAIVRCRHLDKAYYIEIYRVGKSGKYLCSKPCKICMSGISKTPIRIIKYVNKDGYWTECSI
jgi:deoxycytidylate deaminase